MVFSMKEQKLSTEMDLFNEKFCLVETIWTGFSFNRVLFYGL